MCIETSPPLILIVDDSRQDAEILKMILEDYEYKIAVATNGIQALESVRKMLPDLILLDVMMPEMDGFEVCKQLKNAPETKGIPVIFITSKDETDDVVKGFEIGAVDYVTKPFKDTELTARIKTHLELKHAREELKKSNAAKDRFFSILAHDLRNPFAVISSFVNIMTRDIGNLSQSEIVELTLELKKKSDRTYSLLENLLKWSASQTNRILFDPEPFDLSNIVEYTITILQDSATQKEIKLESRLIPGLMVTADKNMISTVVRNLISNAIKFTHKGGNVIIKTKSSNGQGEMIVKDTGVGMDQETISKLFRIDISHTTVGTSHEKGSGLGLILCKEFIDKHNGKIGVKSGPGKGSEFSFTIP